MRRETIGPVPGQPIGRIERLLLERRLQGRRSLIAFMNAGDPDLVTTRSAIELAAHHGIDVIELGVPFPRSCTDGPTILRSHQRGLAAGATLAAVLRMVRELRCACDIPIVLLAEFAHTVRPIGLEGFLRTAREAGVDGTLVHCLPPLLERTYLQLAEDSGIEPILSVFPVTPAAKRASQYESARGFLYLVSRYGRTGGAPHWGGKTTAFIRQVRNETSIPLAVGFGVKTPEHLLAIYREGADACIVGSAITEIVEQHLHSRRELPRALGGYFAALSRCRSVR